ncbi:Spindle assembly abnormal protein 6 [Terramyces sp. JEL0728]|nr:Spindle assembly abnormal protein 6 [Terramyces sp. JEL0728]
MEVLFNKPIQLNIKNQTENKKPVNIKISQLNFQLTDDNDPFFFFYLDIIEQDFHLIKQDQGLLIDFVEFPSKLIELLEACISSGRDLHPKFIAQLQQDERYSTFSIIEANSFKHINHLSLKFNQGNDFTIKEYLATTQTFNLQQALAISTRTNKESEQIISKISAETEHLRIKHSEDINTLKQNHLIELTREKERFMGDKHNFRESNEQMLNNTKTEYEQKVKYLSEKLNGLNVSYTHILKHSQTLETSNAELSKKLESVSQDLSFARQESERLSVTKQHLQDSNKMQAVKIELLEHNLKESKERERVALEEKKKAVDRVDLIQVQIKREEDSVQVLKHQVEGLEQGLKKAGEEINKGNEIIKRLQMDLKNAKSKIKLKNTVTLQQERLLDERMTSIDSLQKDLVQSNRVNHDLQADLEGNRKKITDLNSQLDESRKIIEDNNRVIEWLHKQLNEEALQKPLYSKGFTQIDFSKYTTVEPEKFDFRQTPKQKEELGFTPREKDPLSVPRTVTPKLPKFAQPTTSIPIKFDQPVVQPKSSYF